MPSTLSPIDWSVIGFYLLGVVFIGIYSSGKQRSTRDYFLGGRELPWWAVTLSIIATETSAVTLIGFPGQAYAGDWRVLELFIGFVFGRIFLARYFIETFYRFDVVTVYGFLERRFGHATRVLAALFFLAGRVIGSGVRLFAACLAFQAAAGLPLEWGIAIISAIGLAYTLLGGIRAVVWTECILGLTFIASGVAAVACLLADIEGGLGAVLRQPDLASKLRIFFLGVEGQGLSSTWSEFFASTQPLAIGLAGGFVLTLATHGTDQDIVQRVLTCKDSRSGGKSLLGSAVLVLPLAALFLLVGSLLYFLHQLHPEAVPAAALKPDEQFPRYIVERVPAGLAGFIFAGIFAATLSSLASVLNALASTLIADFYRPYFRRQADETHYLRASRAATLLAGAAVALTAWAFIGSGESILDLALQVLTYFYGGILGVFLLGIFTHRGSPVFAVAGMMAGVAVVLLLQLRAFIDQPSKAPKAVADLIGRIPDAAADLIARCVPLLAWPLWIVAGSAVAFAIGAAGRQTIVRR